LVKEVGLSRWIFARDIWAEEDKIWGSETPEVTITALQK
jgi:hypothetical protein